MAVGGGPTPDYQPWTQRSDAVCVHPRRKPAERADDRPGRDDCLKSTQTRQPVREHLDLRE